MTRNGMSRWFCRDVSWKGIRYFVWKICWNMLLFLFKRLDKARISKKNCSSWKTSSYEERQQLIKKHISTYQQKHGKNTLFSFRFSRIGRKTTQMPDISINSSSISSSSASYETMLKTPNASGCEHRKDCIDAHEKYVVNLFLTALKVDTDKFLNEHALKEEFLMKYSGLS